VWARRAPAVCGVLARALIVAGLVASASSCGLAEASGAADVAADRFHMLYQDEKWGEIYAEASPRLRQVTTEADFAELMSAIRRKLGAYRSASRTSVNVNATTDGTTVSQVFDTEFAEGHATEELRWSIVSGRAVLLYYNINSPLLILR